MEGKVCVVSLKNPKIKMQFSCVDYEREFLLGAFLILYFGVPFCYAFIIKWVKNRRKESLIVFLIIIFIFFLGFNFYACAAKLNLIATFIDVIKVWFLFMCLCTTFRSPIPVRERSNGSIGNNCHQFLLLYTLGSDKTGETLI